MKGIKKGLHFLWYFLSTSKLYLKNEFAYSNQNTLSFVKCVAVLMKMKLYLLFQNPLSLRKKRNGTKFAINCSLSADVF